MRRVLRPCSWKMQTQTRGKGFMWKGRSDGAMVPSCRSWMFWTGADANAEMGWKIRVSMQIPMVWTIKDCPVQINTPRFQTTSLGSSSTNQSFNASEPNVAGIQQQNLELAARCNVLQRSLEEAREKEQTLQQKVTQLQGQVVQLQQLLGNGTVPNQSSGQQIIIFNAIKLLRTIGVLA
ncbi:hypothetical protein M427DRAFT_319606 [Gonapodya prolifera JEL478]|uniref:Uncharacterized protein n=1 Tax=Gonapodya prolifera (strain JEL478) TaxID=1344416 RepID=A0A139AXG7_GONPJ|nr:hypothetical protein M427DRAFT_319606 [Gonapodya prolifera JEL478]|eukprot:KXS21442.1 hypothetical protein M427DRAFT_319606 [Gonapodya prolifera JEL478]